MTMMETEERLKRKSEARVNNMGALAYNPDPSHLLIIIIKIIRYLFPTIRPAKYIYNSKQY